MRFGVREICNVVFKATVANQRVGAKEFAKGQPVIYFDSLKTSTMEQAVTTVYAQGGRGNTRLVAWDGEKTLTFTMEDALISEMGLAILASAKLYNAGKSADNGSGNATDNTLIVHVTETINVDGDLNVTKQPTKKNNVQSYVLPLDENGEIMGAAISATFDTTSTKKLDTTKLSFGTDVDTAAIKGYLVDYYYEVKSGATQIDIEPENFGGNFYIEADTLFRDTNGKDHAAQFVIPNGKVQSNFTLTMASSGDPSTFTFTVDAFPGYVNGDLTKKVMAAIQILGDETVAGIDDAAGDDDTTITVSDN